MTLNPAKNIYPLPTANATTKPDNASTTNPQDGPLVLECEQGIVLKAGNAVLRLLPNGELQLNGQTITLQAQTTVAIQSTQLRINCEADS